MPIKFKSRKQEHIVKCTIALVLLIGCFGFYDGRSVIDWVLDSEQFKLAFKAGLLLFILNLAWGKLSTPKKSNMELDHANKNALID
jgi:hypothetical protein